METSTEKKSREVIDAINSFDFKNLSIDKFLECQQLIGELTKSNIEFNRLVKFGCPSQYIDCKEVCEGNKTSKDKSKCSQCWQNALSEEINVAYGNEETTPEEDASPETKSKDNTYDEAFQTSPLSEGAGYFAAAQEAIKQQFSRPQKEKKFFNKKEKKSEYDKLKVLNLTPNQILELFDIMKWQEIQDFDDLKSALKEIF